ncbi:MAG TPA: glycoside hydrolase family 18 protein [Terracidiphilus sp.]|nr:glycoside hydrolase family 18 protein [Terracidiphilus sp.]
MGKVRLKQRAMLVLLALCLVAAGAEAAEPVVAGYVFPQNALLQDGSVSVRGMTRINYAFANIQNGRMVEGAATDAQNLTWLVAQKKDHPALQVLVSVGGWLWSGGFSDAARTSQSRNVFADSVMAFLQRYQLDGLDVDWEYPGMRGAGHKFRKEDRENFTLLLRALRERFKKESERTHHRLYLTIAAGASDEFLQHTEMDKVQALVDAVNLMAYDYYEAGSDETTGNHAPLFTDPHDPKGVSADASVQAFERAGVPPEKLVLGVPFYGRMWGDVPDVNHGLFQPGKTVADAYAPYTRIAGSLLGHGFVRYWDASSSVPYLYNAEQHVFVSYEDPESLAAKCKYVRKRGLGGVMFWSYSDDATGALLGALDRGLSVAGGNTAGSR